MFQVIINNWFMLISIWAGVIQVLYWYCIRNRWLIISRHCNTYNHTSLHGCTCYTIYPGYISFASPARSLIRIKYCDWQRCEQWLPWCFFIYYTHTRIYIWGGGGGEAPIYIFHGGRYVQRFIVHLRVFCHCI